MDLCSCQHWKINIIVVRSVRGANVHWEDGWRDVESGRAGHNVWYVGGGGRGIDIRIVGDARELGLEGLVEFCRRLLRGASVLLRGSVSFGDRWSQLIGGVAVEALHRTAAGCTLHTARTW